MMESPCPPCPPAENPFDPVEIARVHEQAELALSQAHSFVVIAMTDDPPVGRTFVGFRSPEVFQQMVLTMVRTMTSNNTVMRHLFLTALAEIVRIAGAALDRQEHGPDRVM